MEKIQKAEIQAGLKIMFAVAETIREAGSIPSGTLYAALVGRVDINGYESIIRTLKNTGLVTEQSHMLTWVGPEIQKGGN
jgi:hypothetical protein